MASTVTKSEAKSFDRTPFIYEKKEVDEFGNEFSNSFYSVKGRKQEFSFLYADGRYETEIVKLTDTFAVVCCKVYLTANATTPKAVAHASRELEKNDIGRRFVECAETAAIGRALDNAGIGADVFLDAEDKAGYEETLGSPIGRKVSSTATVEPTSASPTVTAVPKTEAEALKVVIQTTESQSLKGSTFAVAISKAKEVDKFAAFLTVLTQKGNEAEKAAAAILLPKFAPKKSTNGDAA